MSYETVNHPPHYNSHPSGVECITIIQHFSYNVGAAVKYLWRAGLKPNASHIEDLRKAIRYIEYEIERLSTTQPYVDVPTISIPDAPEWAKWYSVDADRQAHVYTDIPVYDNDTLYWYADREAGDYDKWPDLLPATEWKQTLRRIVRE